MRLVSDAEDTGLTDSFQTALARKAQIVHLLTLQPGESVRYGQEYVANQAMTIAVMPVGYADGCSRTVHNLRPLSAESVWAR